jgi:hypothetical protein
MTEPVESSSSRSPTILQSQRPLGCLPYAIGAASFIPVAGVLPGLIAVVWGLARKARAVTVLGASGILFSVVYAAVFYFGMIQPGPLSGWLRSYMAVYALNSAVMDIESYKLQYGRYPVSLSEVEPKPKTRINNFIDPTSTRRGGVSNGRFYYQLDSSGKFYYLRSLGPDGIPFTDDDILPALSENERKKTGLRLQRW